MRKQARSSTLLLAWLSVAATPVLADIVQLELHPGFRSGPGGEFLIEPVAGFSFTPGSRGENSFGWFETFCVEKDEFIQFDKKYYAVINDHAVGGGGGPNPDPLDPKTAYLYQKFIDGELASYDFGVGSERIASADALQDIIWFIENEQAWKSAWTPGTLQHTFYQDAQASAGSSIGNVRILNLYGDAGLTQEKQDQLVVIPAPGAALLGMIGLGMLGARRRRNA